VLQCVLQCVLQHAGCNNGGGGGIFSKVKWLVAKWVGTRKRLFSGFEREKVFLRQGHDFRNARTLSPGKLYSQTGPILLR